MITAVGTGTGVAVDLAHAECGRIRPSRAQRLVEQAAAVEIVEQAENAWWARGVGRRQLVLAGVFGVLFFPMARLSGGVRKNFNRAVIRPPGSVAEDEFLRRCIKCRPVHPGLPDQRPSADLFEAASKGSGPRS